VYSSIQGSIDRRIMVLAAQALTPYLKDNQSKKGRRYGLSDTVPSIDKKKRCGV
jgi:hypothetical protein